MEGMKWFWGAALIVLTLMAAGGFLWQRFKHRRMMGRLMDMLDGAINGTLCEHIYDESLYSAAENKLHSYLSASLAASGNLAEEKDKIKELIADIAHQTKTPIANILLYAQLLGEQDVPDESRSCVAALCSQAEKLSFLISSLLRLSRLETGVLAVRPEKNRISPMLEEVETQLSPEAGKKGITLIFESGADEETAVFDPKWTEEAVFNLVDNAVKYTTAGGSVHVDVRAYELFCRIDVRDNGPGIPEEEQAKVFTRFYRSPSVSSREGVGVGLYLARQILSIQGGYIKVLSEEGKGSVFSAFLPRGG